MDIWPRFFENCANLWFNGSGCNQWVLKVFIRVSLGNLLPLYFFLEKSCSQLYVLPNSNDMNQANYEVKDTFLLKWRIDFSGKKGLIKV